jgi:hypothetical protein
MGNALPLLIFRNTKILRHLLLYLWPFPWLAEKIQETTSYFIQGGMWVMDL